VARARRVCFSVEPTPALPAGLLSDIFLGSGFFNPQAISDAL